jgi:ABC-type transport system involved in multi-copper enzyme maturation permease subunit
MSSIPPATSDPIPPAGAPAPPGQVLGPLAPVTPGETAPSTILSQAPTLTRVIGVVGLFFTVLGAVVIVTTRAIGPRIVPESFGFVFAGFGLACLLYHAVTDQEQEIRRMYGILAGLLLLLGLASGLLPGPYDGTGGPKQMGYYLLPWGLGAGLLALLFAIPFVRHETDELLHDIGLYALLAIGALLCAGIVIAGFVNPDFLTGPGLPLALLGVGFLCAFLGQVDTTDGIGYYVALGLGVLGGAMLFVTFALAVFPTVLFEGPSALRTPYQTLDRWPVAGRVLLILASLGVAALGALARYPIWLRAVITAIGLVTAGVFITGSLSAQIHVPPKTFLVPGGLILGFLGLVYLVVALAVCSDNQFITLTRREFSVYFFSPIGYLVLGGMAFCQWFQYWQFYELLAGVARRNAALPEPIIGDYLLDLIPILCVILPVPALTMRLLSEEKRTGSLEVLFTSPVNEWPVVLSKFLATWLFFMICWLPAGLFLIAIRMEAAAPFDYRPLLSFYLALGVCAAAFISIGLFFSSLTSNQIVAAVLTFLVLLFFVVCYFAKRNMTGIGPTAQALVARLSFIDLWIQSLRGQLPVRDILVWASVAVFNLFLSVKRLEARKWN